MVIHQGKYHAKGMRFAIVVSRFNEWITRRLLESAVEALSRCGVSQKAIEVVWVPGALEIPFFCKKLGSRKRFDAVIALACVLRGSTYHYECVCHEVTRGISQAALETQVPMATAIITADTLKQALERTGLKAGNKGSYAALAAVEIADLNRQFSKGKRL